MVLLCETRYLATTIKFLIMTFGVLFFRQETSAHPILGTAPTSSRAARRAFRGRGSGCRVLPVTLVSLAAIAATVTVVVAVPVFVPVLLVVVTSLLVGRGGAGRRPVAGLSVVPARLASVVLSLLFGRIRAAAGVLCAVRIGGAAPRPLGTCRGFLAGGFRVFVIIQ
jgi:hypothetical protein